MILAAVVVMLILANVLVRWVQPNKKEEEI